MGERFFGEVPGVSEGYHFQSRLELSAGWVHRPIQAGISGSQKEGADSIVLSGGYEDDEDHGDVIIYTGHGGRDQSSGKQVTDQELVRQNLALAISCSRGYRLESFEVPRISLITVLMRDTGMMAYLGSSITGGRREKVDTMFGGSGWRKFRKN